MAKLKLGAIEDDKLIKVAHELPAIVHRDLAAYAEILAQETGQPVQDPAKLIAPMLASSWRRTGAFAKLGARVSVRMEARGSALTASSMRPTWVVVVRSRICPRVEPAAAGSVAHSRRRGSHTIPAFVLIRLAAAADTVALDFWRLQAKLAWKTKNPQRLSVSRSSASSRYRRGC